MATDPRLDERIESQLEATAAAVGESSRGYQISDALNEARAAIASNEPLSDRAFEKLSDLLSRQGRQREAAQETSYPGSNRMTYARDNPDRVGGRERERSGADTAGTGQRERAVQDNIFGVLNRPNVGDFPRDTVRAPRRVRLM